MIIKFFKNNPAVSIVLVPVMALALWSFSFFHPAPVNLKHAMPFFEVLGSWFNQFRLGANILAVILIIIEGLFLNYMMDKHEVLGKATYLPAFMYVVLMSCSPPFLTLHQIIPANLFLLFALNSLFNMYRKENAFGNAFDTGLFISIASLFYFPAIVLFLMVWIGFIILRPFIWREYIICFIGLLVPYIFACVYYFWFDVFDYLWYDKMFYPLTTRPFTFDHPESYYILFYTCIGLLMLSLIKLLNIITAQSIKARGILVILLWFMIFGLLSFLISPEISGKYLALAIIPFSVFSGYYFMTVKKSWWGELLMLILLGVIFYTHLDNTFR